MFFFEKKRTIFGLNEALRLFISLFQFSLLRYSYYARMEFQNGWNQRVRNTKLRESIQKIVFVDHTCIKYKYLAQLRMVLKNKNLEHYTAIIILINIACNV